MLRHKMICLFTVLVMAISGLASACALESTTLHNGSRGEEVRVLQQVLINLGFLKGNADGIFGNKTEDAVRKFQGSRNLTVDGLAGKKTRSLLQDAASKTASASSDASAQTEAAPKQASSAASEVPVTSASSGSALFNGNYATIRLKDRGARVKILQDALIRLNYLSGKADGIFGNLTMKAVLLFQQENKLSADGIAGKKTLSSLEKAVQNGSVRGSSSSPSSVSSSAESVSSTASAQAVKTASAPDGKSVRLLHWFNDIKPSLGSGSRLIILDPSSGITWTLRVMSCGRHCDAEPMTKQDTANMLKAFGGIHTWNQKAVYVQLPSGVWTIGSTHDNPHLSGGITDNDFNGHLCVHFLRDLSEAQENDPNYGVSNQKTIRSFWKSLTGEEIAN